MNDLTKIQLRLPEELVKEIDELVKTGKFNNRSGDIRVIVTLYNEREKTREFLKML